MGGLRKFMPITAGTFIVGWLAIAGIFPLSGFWSKDEILAKAWFAKDYALWAVGVVAALLTAFYMTRQVWLVFYGKERWRDAHALLDQEAPERSSTVHEPERVPVAAATAKTSPCRCRTSRRGRCSSRCSCSRRCRSSGGLVNLPFEHNAQSNLLDRWLEPVVGVAAVTRLVRCRRSSSRRSRWRSRSSASSWATAFYSEGSARRRHRSGRRATSAASPRCSERAYYFDFALARFVSGPVTAFANFLSNGIDRGVIDGAVNGIGSLVPYGRHGPAAASRPGIVRNYALGIVFGTVLLVVYVATRVTL